MTGEEYLASLQWYVDFADSQPEWVRGTAENKRVPVPERTMTKEEWDAELNWHTEFAKSLPSWMRGTAENKRNT